MSGTTRAQFLTRGAQGGVALVAGGSVLALAEGTAFGAASADTDILKLAATAELLAIDFYTRSIKAKKLKGAELAYLSAAMSNERAHYAALKGALKSATPAGLKFKYPQGSFASRKSIGTLGEALETAFVGAYMGAVTAFKSNELKGVAAEIGACESRHLSVLTNIAASTIVPSPNLPKVLTAAQAQAALKPFLA
jgi:hypothetical protein